MMKPRSNTQIITKEQENGNSCEIKTPAIKTVKQKIDKHKQNSTTDQFAHQFR